MTEIKQELLTQISIIQAKRELMLERVTVCSQALLEATESLNYLELESANLTIELHKGESL